MSEDGDFKYWAFISYSTQDRKWGNWFHQSLERYVIPKKLRGKKTVLGTVPRRLFPIFQDRAELASSTDLGGNLREALQQSRALVVVCSPQAAQSRWVNEEIVSFLGLGRNDRIFPVVIAGEPNATDAKPRFAASDEAFPLALRDVIADNGNAAKQSVEPLAADVRPGKDGRNNAKLKLIAGLLGLNYDDLKRRDATRQRNRIFASIFFGFSLIGAAGSIWKYQQTIDERRLVNQKNTQKAIEVQAAAQKYLLTGDSLSSLQALSEVPDSFRNYAQIGRLTGLTLRNISGLRYAFDQPADFIRSIKVNATSNVAAAMTEHGVAKLIDVTNGQVLRQFAGGSGRTLFTGFNRNGHKFINLTDQGGTIYDLEDKSTVDLKFNLKTELPNSGVFDTKLDFVATSHLFQDVQGTMTRLLIWDSSRGERISDQALVGIYKVLSLSKEWSRMVIVGGKFQNGKYVSFAALILDPATGQTIATLPLQNSSDALFIRIEENGDRAIFLGEKLSQKIYDLTNGQELFTLGNEKVVPSRAEWMGPNRTILSYNRDHSFSLWDGNSGALICSLEPNRLSAITLSPSGAYLATISYIGEALIRDGHSGQVIKRFEDRIGWEQPFADGGSTQNLSFAADDAELIIANGRTHFTKIWNWKDTRSSKVSLPMSLAPISEVAFTQKGSLLFKASEDGHAGFFSSSDGTETAELKDSSFVGKWVVSQALFNPEASRLIAGGRYREATVWSIATGLLVSTLHVEQITAEGNPSSFVAMSPDGKQCLSINESGNGAIWSQVTLTPELKLSIPIQDYVACAFFSSNGANIFVGTTKGRIWRCDAKTAASQRIVEAACDNLLKIFPSGDNKSLFVADRLAGVTVYDLNGVRKKSYACQPVGINDVQESPDAKLLVAACSDDRVRLFDEDSGECRLLAQRKIEAEDIMAGPAAFPPLTTGDRVEGGFGRVAVSPDGTLIAGSNIDGNICIWDTSTGEQIARFPSHGIFATPVTRLVFDETSHLLVNGNRDGSGFLWCLTPEETPGVRISNLLHQILR